MTTVMSLVLTVNVTGACWSLILTSPRFRIILSHKLLSSLHCKMQFNKKIKHKLTVLHISVDDFKMKLNVH